jgi:LPXTG-motif cell wall-anchored protein
MQNVKAIGGQGALRYGGVLHMNLKQVSRLMLVASAGCFALFGASVATAQTEAPRPGGDVVVVAPAGEPGEGAVPAGPGDTVAPGGSTVAPATTQAPVCSEQTLGCLRARGILSGKMIKYYERVCSTYAQVPKNRTQTDRGAAAEMPGTASPYGAGEVVNVVAERNSNSCIPRADYCYAIRQSATADGRNYVTTGWSDGSTVTLSSSICTQGSTQGEPGGIFVALTPDQASKMMSGGIDTSVVTTAGFGVFRCYNDNTGGDLGEVVASNADYSYCYSYHAQNTTVTSTTAPTTTTVATSSTSSTSTTTAGVIVTSPTTVPVIVIGTVVTAPATTVAPTTVAPTTLAPATTIAPVVGGVTVAPAPATTIAPTVAGVTVLPRTGSEQWILALIGASLAGIGAGLLVMNRRLTLR